MSWAVDWGMSPPLHRHGRPGFGPGHPRGSASSLRRHGRASSLHPRSAGRASGSRFRRLTCAGPAAHHGVDGRDKCSAMTITPRRGTSVPDEPFLLPGLRRGEPSSWPSPAGVRERGRCRGLRGRPPPGSAGGRPGRRSCSVPRRGGPDGERPGRPPGAGLQPARVDDK